MRFAISKSLQDLLKILNQRQRDVVIARFGLAKNQEIETLSQIGKRMGITRERVRQIESVALKTLGKTVKENGEWSVFLAKSKNILEQAGGVMRRDKMLGELRNIAPDIFENY